MMDHDQIRRMLDDHEKRLRRLEEAPSATGVAGTSSKAAPGAPAWAVGLSETLCPLCLSSLGQLSSCEHGNCPMRSA